MKKKVQGLLSNNHGLLKEIEQLQSLTNDIKYQSLQEMLSYIDEELWETDENHKKFMGIFYSVLKSILAEYRKTDIYPSTSYTANVLFHSLKNTTLNANMVISEVVDFLHINGLTNSALVVFPIYSFGIADVGLISKLRGHGLHFETRDILLFPQQNNIKDAKKNLEIAKNSFRMRSFKFEEDLLDHYLRSRPLKWFEVNQLLVCRVGFSSADSYENEYFLVRYLERSICKIFLSYTLLISKKLPAKNKELSTRMINNWQTKDIDHYLVFTKDGKKLVPECIPIHRELSNVLELSKLNIDMPISFDPKIRNQLDIINLLIDQVYQGCMMSGLQKNNQEFKFYEKFRRSLVFFSRSYQTRYEDDEVLYLSVAYELLFSDGITNNISQVLRTNLACLYPSKADEIFIKIKELYNSRSGAAHEGTARRCDIIKCRELYLEVILIVSRLIRNGKINIASKKPFALFTEIYLKNKIGFLPISKM